MEFFYRYIGCGCYNYYDKKIYASQPQVERLGSRSRIAQTPPVKPSPSVTPDLSSTPTNFPMPPSSSSSPNDNGTATATGSPTEDGAYPLTTVKSRGATFTSKMTNFVNNGISITSALLYEKKNHHPRRVQVGMKLDLITELKGKYEDIIGKVYLSTLSLFI